MKRAGLEGVVARDCDRMDRRTIMAEPDVASLLADYSITEVLQCANDTIY
jgi:hypothetical protein